MMEMMLVAMQAIRARMGFAKSGMVPTIVRPPNGLDPDDWIDQSSKAKVLSVIQSPKEYIDFHIELYNGNELVGPDRQQYIISLSKEVKGIEDGVIRNDLIKMISEKLSVDEHDFIKSVNTQRVNPETNYEDEINNEEKFTFSAKLIKRKWN